MIDRDDLARYISGKPRAPVPPQTIAYAEDLLLHQAETRARAVFAAAQAAANLRTQTRTPIQRVAFFMPFKQNLKNRLQTFITTYKNTNNTNNFPQDKIDRFTQLSKDEIKNIEKLEELQRRET